MDLLQVEHLRRDFGAVRAVDDVSFTVKKGEVLGIVGESGSGKTTLGRCILQIYRPTAGKILFRGEPLGSNGKRFDRRIAMVFQDPLSSLNPRMTVEEIVGEGLRIAGQRDPVVIRRKVARMLDLVGLLPEHASRYPHEFSGGQRQRIGIARALIMEPELLVADEPVSALDVSVQAQVINLLSDLKEQLGLTVIFIAHDLSVVKYFSDRIGVMHRGKLVELAEGEELFARPLHPYTKALLSAIPQPDPVTERKRVRLRYDFRTAHDYRQEEPQMRQVLPGHFVFCSETEAEGFRREAEK